LSRLNALSITQPFECLLRPLRGSAAGVIVVFSVLLTLAAHAGLFGIPLALILTSCFFKYAYILFDHTVWGFEEPPHLDIQLLNPLDEQRPLAQCLILGLEVVAIAGVWPWIGARSRRRPWSRGDSACACLGCSARR
jgi:hypothetical protein